MIRKILNISLLIGQLLLNRSAQGLSTQQGANHLHKSVVSENDKPTSILMNVNEPKLTRRKWITSSLTSFGISQSILPLAYAAETVGKDENCNSPQCLGVWGGMLADCPHSKSMMSVGAGCASSQDDTPGVFSEPWDYSESDTLDWEVQMRRLVPAIQLVSSKRGDQVQILTQIKRYVRVVFTDAKTSERSVGEFYFTPDDTTIQFRVGSLNANTGASSTLVSMSTLSSMKNLERCEAIRKQLGYLKLPVLRNRKRSFFFGESDFDTFGPGSALLKSPAEMGMDEIYGGEDVDPNLKIDFVQSFPQRKNF